MKQLTESQKKIYAFLKERAQYGIPPSVREICAATGLKSTSTVHAHLRTLEQLGYIERGAGLNRSITLKGSSPTAQVPILGKITAGMPILAVEESLGSIPYSAFGIDPEELFALHVEGESMRNAAILDGDYVIAKKSSAANNGDIVVALIDDEATVKRYFLEKNGIIRLQPENPAYDPIFSDKTVILGVVIAVIRYYHR